ncbi:MAG TPA: DMT family transporter [Anaeromyxobacter sp.]|nr:DMT family transporter [Anaeromyxobacter sp.]
MEIVLVVLALAAGAGLPVQAGVNAALARHAGRAEWAAFVNFAVGLVALAAWLAALRLAPPPALALARAPWWSWTGGVLGAFYVSAITLLAPRLGVAATLGLAVAGQMVAALALDQVGALGLEIRPMTPSRLAGAALLVLAVVLIRR